LTIARIREMAGGDYPVIRIMPNTPASIGEGMILYAAEGVTEEERDRFLYNMAAAGRFDALPESLIDAGSAVSGCGPAFVYPFIEALADGAVACGLPRDKAQEYAAQTLVGAAKLVLESGQHPGALKDAVCSPGGSTIAGVRALEQRGFRSAATEAVVAAYEKTKALGKQ
ncbi:MAG: pyrroline-5-carboxylate reductase, partial [Clostridiales bacterium]|nr:pyrroline-5-carboxylate reductase [Clostridiales bacterium]